MHKLASSAGGDGQARGSLAVVGGLGAVGSLAGVWAAESRAWQVLTLLGRTGRASEQTLTILSGSSKVRLGIARPISWERQQTFTLKSLLLPTRQMCDPVQQGPVKLSVPAETGLRSEAGEV